MTSKASISAMAVLLGIDIGTGSVKALIVDERGSTLGQGSSEYSQSRPHPGWAEQRPVQWWQATLIAVRQAIAITGGIRIDAIGLSGQMHGTVLLDATGEPVRPAIIWADTRSADEAAEITTLIGPARLIDIAGSPVATGFQAASVKWVQKHEPDVWERVQTILLPKDYLRFKLTGEFFAEPSDASSTLLLDVRTRDWSETILNTLSIQRSQLPPIIESNAMAGRLGQAAADALGLPVGIPIAGGGADAPLSALAAGVVRPDKMALTISTGSQVIIPSATLLPDPDGRIHSWCNCLRPGEGRSGWYQMGATMVSGLALRWLRDSVFRIPGKDAYSQMTLEADGVPVGAGGLVFLPYLNGERTPHMNPHARGMFLGLTPDHGQGHFVRAVMEGGTLALYDAFDVLKSLGAAPDSIVLSGGGAQSSLWRQIVADVFGMAVKPLLTVEQSALGAAMLASSAIGLFDPQDLAERWATYGETVEPNRDAHEDYGVLLEIFRNAYRKHVDDFKALTQFAF